MNQTNENSSGGVATTVRTWRERMGVSLDFPLSMPSTVERAMEDEIAELRAARPEALSPVAVASENFERLFLAACTDLGLISEALGLDPDDGGADPILDAIEELMAQIVPEGLKLVPLEPTVEQLRVELTFDASGCQKGEIYRSMLAAAPTLPHPGGAA